MNEVIEKLIEMRKMHFDMASEIDETLKCMGVELLYTPDGVRYQIVEGEKE